MKHDELREAVARALWSHPNDEGSWDAIVSLAETGDVYMVGQVEFARVLADAALAVIREALKEPTLEMVEAGKVWRERPDLGEGIGEVT